MMSFLAGEATRRIQRHRGDGGRACGILSRDAVQVTWALGTIELDNVSMGDALARLVDAVDGHWIKGHEGQRPLAHTVFDPVFDDGVDQVRKGVPHGDVVQLHGAQRPGDLHRVPGEDPGGPATVPSMALDPARGLP